MEGPDDAHAGCIVVLIATCRSGDYAHEQRGRGGSEVRGEQGERPL